MTSNGGKGSNASNGGKGSGIVGFQRVTIGKDDIPTSSTVPADSSVPSNGEPLPQGVPDVIVAAYERLTRATAEDEYHLYGIDPAEIKSSVTEDTVREALAVLAEVRDNYRFGLYRRGARIQTPTQNIDAGVEAYESLGYETDAARRKLTDLYVNTAWEAPDGGYDSNWRR